MGIAGFSEVVQLLSKPTKKPNFFDSILVDVQSFIYIGIRDAIQSNQQRCLNEIAHITWKEISNLLNELLSSEHDLNPEKITIVLSFDGEGVPMKWPTQRERRKPTDQSRGKLLEGKNLYRFALFGTNTLASHIEGYIIKRLKQYYFSCTRQLSIYICGCNVPGEGEHKMFHIAEALPSDQCCHPIVVSVDHDVFILSFLRLDRYKSIQIHRRKEFYQISKMERDHIDQLKNLSFLFGNDFIPSLIKITPINAPTIVKYITSDEVDTCSNSTISSLDDEEIDEASPAHILSQFIKQMESHIRYQKIPHMDRQLVVSFWVTYYWILDYYCLTSFPQMFLENSLYDRSDRNQLLTALINEKYSSTCLKEAHEYYKGCVTHRPTDVETQVFTETSWLEQLKPYWIKSNDEACTVLKFYKLSKKLK